jgi:outer membrane receptor for Fe3+-dicitrate
MNKNNTFKLVSEVTLTKNSGDAFAPVQLVRLGQTDFMVIVELLQFNTEDAVQSLIELGEKYGAEVERTTYSLIFR